MSLSRLAKVELQLVMHCCDLPSLLQLARCSRSTLAAASDAFAWRHLPLLTFDIGRVFNVGVRLQSTRLLRHSDTRLTFVSAGPGHSRAALICEDLLQQVTIMPRLRVLHATSMGKRIFDEAGWTRFFSLPSVRGITDLHAGIIPTGYVSSFLQRVRTCIPTLTSLHADIHFDEDNAALLPLIRQLTHLAINTHSAHVNSGVMRIGECTQLRSLRLESVDHDALIPILTSPGLHQLHTLHLTQVNAQGSSDGVLAPPDWVACLTHLTRLTSLTLQWCSGVDTVLQAISTHSPGLRSLRLIVSVTGVATGEGSPGAVDNRNNFGHELPSAAALAELAISIPGLHIYMRFHPLSYILRRGVRNSIRRLALHPWSLLAELTESGMDDEWAQQMRAALPPCLTASRLTLGLAASRSQWLLCQD